MEDGPWDKGEDDNGKTGDVYDNEDDGIKMHASFFPFTSLYKPSSQITSVLYKSSVELAHNLNLSVSPRGDFEIQGWTQKHRNVVWTHD